jgi:anti-anti-sigma factor
MPLEKWSDRVVVAHLAGDAPIADDLDAAERMVSMTPMDAVLDFGGVTYLNSTDLARLIKLRKKVAAQEAKLLLCNVPAQLWSTFLVTGLDKIFTFSDSVSTALASLQMKP